ncbi:MAG: peptidyl-prolyl cis-trans isomerase, EpsD family [Chlorobaculum sp.]|nr:peptidyl-prolyl cis-trans isomerase, EpsD family [Chlorobaculum sp.]
MKKLTSLLFALLLGILAGCSQQTSKESDSGVAAVVNGVEITKRQIEYLYQRSAMPNMSDAESANLKRRILSDLVSLELLAGKGKEMKLDNSPDYSIALYAAQKNVLAGLAESKIMGNQPPVTADQAESVVQNTPQLFAGRKLFVYDEVLFPGVDMPLLESLDKMAVNGAPLNTLLDELRAKKIPFNKTLIALTSEKIPPQVLSFLNQINPNVAQVIARKGDNISIILLLRAAYPTPLEGESARRAAMAMIASNQKNVAMAKAMNDELNSAKITYYDEYLKKADAKSKLVALPEPDTEKTKKAFRKNILLASGLSLSFILAVMMVTAVIRTLYSMAWLPRLWFGSSSSIERTQHYDIRATSTLTRRIYLAVMVLLISAAMVFSIMLLWNKIDALVLFASIAIGIIAGIIASRLLNFGILQAWSRKTYLIIATLLGVLVLVSVVITLRMSAV